MAPGGDWTEEPQETLVVTPILEVFEPVVELIPVVPLVETEQESHTEIIVPDDK